LANTPTGDWYYGINVDEQTVTQDELSLFGDGTAAARKMLDIEAGYIPVTAAYFPDAAFRSYLEANFDLNGDGFLSPSERNAVTSINIVGTKTAPLAITSLAGIEDFPNLTDLTVRLAVYLVSVDLSRNTALTTVDLLGDGLTSLDVSNNTALTELRCGNNYIPSIDLSHNPALTYLGIGGNYLTAIDLSHNTQLTYLDIAVNRLTTLNISSNKALTSLFCQYDRLTGLVLTGIPGLSNGSGKAASATLEYANQGGVYTTSGTGVLYDSGVAAYTMIPANVKW